MVLKVLVCDDAGFIRGVLTHAILELGHKVIGEARDGNEAVELALKLKPDVVLMDLVLPLKNGVEAAKDIKALLGDTKIVAISSTDESFLKKKAADIGCDAYLAKPFSKVQLKAIFDMFKKTAHEVQNG